MIWKAGCHLFCYPPCCKRFATFRGNTNHLVVTRISSNAHQAHLYTCISESSLYSLITLLLAFFLDSCPAADVWIFLGHKFNDQKANILRTLLTFCSIIPVQWHLYWLRDKQVKQLQELGKRKELERFSLEQDKKSMQASLHDDKIKSILMNIVKASASSYYTAWKGLYFKSRGRLAQIGNTLQSLAGRRMRQRINTSWQGWWEQTLQHRKSKKVARLVAHNLFTRCLLQWVEDVKMTKVARIVMLVGQKEEGQSDRRRRRAWHEWVLYARHIAKLRKAINMITGNREEKTLGDFLNNWRATAAASILSKAGFGSKAKDKSRPGIRRTGSQGLTGSQAPKIGRTTSPTFGRSSRDVFAPKVGRTISPTFSRTSSFESIHEDNNGDRSDQEDSFKKLSLMPSTSSHSSLQPSSPDGSVKRYASTRNVLGGSAKDVFAENSQGSISSVASPASAFCRAPSNASNASHSSLRSPLRSPLVRRPSAYSASEEQQAFSEDLISSEAFLSTLFRKGSVQAI